MRSSTLCLVIVLSLTLLALPLEVNAQSGNRLPAVRTIPPWPTVAHGDVTASTMCGAPAASPLTHVGTIPYAFDNFVAIGDADQDGWKEVYRIGTLGYEVSEHIGGNAYVTVFVGQPLAPIVVGDFDRDGSQEIVGHANGSIQVWESSGPHVFPSLLVWESPPITNVLGWGASGDSDRDGNMEVIYSENTLGGEANLLVMEVVGNNGWAIRSRLPLPGNSAGGRVLIDDLDQDPMIEVSVTGDNGWVFVFESPADNQWVLSDADSNGMSNAFSLTGGFDCDGNGFKEIFVEGNILNPPALLRTLVLEQTPQGELVHRDTLDIPTAWIGIMSNAIDDFDGDGSAEYLMQASVGARFYKHLGSNSWCFSDSISVVGGGFYSHDLNMNGLPEVVFNSVSPSILEAPGTVTSTGVHLSSSFRVYPNPTRGAVTLRTVSQMSSSLLRVYDVRGRLIASDRLRGDGCAGFTWDTASVPHGVYLLRLGEGEPSATVRLIVNR